MNGEPPAEGDETPEAYWLIAMSNEPGLRLEIGDSIEIDAEAEIGEPLELPD